MGADVSDTPSILRLTEPVVHRNVRPSINLWEMLQGLRAGTVLTGFVGEAQPSVFGPIQTWTARFLIIDGLMYFFAEGELSEFEVGSYVGVEIKGTQLHVGEPPYPMVVFRLGTFLHACASNLDTALSTLGRSKVFDTGVRLYSIDAARNGRTRVVVYDIPEGAPPEAFPGHLHTAGEVFMVVHGEVRDEHATYTAGCLVTVGPNTVHTPYTVGRTIIVVCWTNGIELLPR